MSESLNFNDYNHDKFADFIEKNCGLYLPKQKYNSLALNIKERMDFLHIDSFTKYFELLNTGGSNQEFQNLIDIITINETSFFRNTAQFDALNKILKEEISIQNKHKLKIWSAGSSTGEEAYSIAITVLENLPASFWEIEILGTDINSNVIQKSKEGIYNKRKLINLPEIYIDKYFDKIDNDNFKISNEVRELVNFKFLNLIKEPYPLNDFNNFDIIFCRNVIIYFKILSTTRVINNFYKSLNDEGYLFLGHSESLFRIDCNFECLDLGSTIVYKKSNKQTINFNEVNCAEKKNCKESAASIVKDNKNEQTQYQKAKSFANQNKNDEALEICNNLINDYPLGKKAYFLKGIILHAMDRNDEAIDCFKKCKYIDTDFIPAYYYLGNIYKKTSNFSDANREYKNVIRLLHKIPSDKENELLEGFSKEMLIQICEHNINILNKNN